MQREFNRTTILIAGLGAVVGGLAIARLLAFPGLVLLIFVLIFILLLAGRRRTSLLIAVVFIGLLIGWFRGSYTYGELNYLKSFSGQKISVEGVAKTDAIYGDKSQIQFELEKINIIDPEQSALPGIFKISGYGEPMIYRGDKVVVTGKLFPTRGSKQAAIAYAELTRTGEHSSWDESLRQNFVAGMYNALPEPQASFGLGLLIGQRSTLPEATLLALSAVGLTHIIAVSGYYLTIIVRGVNRSNIFRSKFQQLVTAITLICGFILITGFSASIVRAGLISILGLWAWYFGRKLRPILSIALVAALTGMINPFYVWSDIGWYLSFLAFFGVLIVAPQLQKRLFKKRSPSNMAQIITETICAYLLTLPLIMYIFGKASMVALVANLLVVPLVPFAMLFSAIAGISGMIAPVLSPWFAMPAKVLLTYMLDIASWLASLPFSQILAKLGTYQMLICYGLILVFLLVLTNKNTRNKRANKVVSRT